MPLQEDCAMSLSIDLNCDMGESFGPWQMGQDEALMPWITSANIACGFHASDPHIMRKTVAAAKAHQVAIGAHPGLPDLQGFGRRPLTLSAQEVYDITVVQIGALAAVATSQDARLHHVKAHGMLYNMAAQDLKLAQAIAQAVADVDARLIVYGLAGSPMIQAAQALGLQTASEVFADRTYLPDGRLTPRSEPDALITDIHQSIAQVLRMIEDKELIARDGTPVPVQAQTLCVHGDQPGALDFVQQIRQALQQ